MSALGWLVVAAATAFGAWRGYLRYQYRLRERIDRADVLRVSARRAREWEAGREAEAARREAEAEDERRREDLREADRREAAMKPRIPSTPDSVAGKRRRRDGGSLWSGGDR